MTVITCFEMPLGFFFWMRDGIEALLIFLQSVPVYRCHCCFLLILAEPRFMKGPAICN